VAAREPRAFLAPVHEGDPEWHPHSELERVLEWEQRRVRAEPACGEFAQVLLDARAVLGEQEGRDFPQ